MTPLEKLDLPSAEPRSCGWRSWATVLLGECLLYGACLIMFFGGSFLIALAGFIQQGQLLRATNVPLLPALIGTIVAVGGILGLLWLIRRFIPFPIATGLPLSVPNRYILSGLLGGIIVAGVGLRLADEHNLVILAAKTREQEGSALLLLGLGALLSAIGVAGVTITFGKFSTLRNYKLSIVPE